MLPARARPLEDGAHAWFAFGLELFLGLGYRMCGGVRALLLPTEMGVGGRPLIHIFPDYV